jgi:hypothetical protein
LDSYEYCRQHLNEAHDAYERLLKRPRMEYNRPAPQKDAENSPPVEEMDSEEE